ncbi:CbiX/SirB N-terminal domain-containing protein [Flavicella sp.]|uniref:sirohydrochlorin chelatase n=1 Tax=Flavicella sp. TaxID=2957742 RepID=UPI0030172AE8
MKKLNNVLIIVFSLMLFSCGTSSKEKKSSEKEEKKIGVLLVNHGSVAKSWRNMLLDVEDQVKEEILSNPKIDKVTTAFMEYTEPSIATRMKEFDAEGFDEVIVVPIFLTVSSHYSHDIPVILGVSSDPKSKDYMIGKEKIEVYKAKARVIITPPLDYSTILKKNVERRVKALSKDAENEGVLLVAYGDAQYNQQWEEMVDDIGKYLKIKTGHESIAYSWCGHLVGYSIDPTVEGIEQLMELEDNVIVIPILVGNDPYFQEKIIQKAVDQVSGNVLYIQDAILPDANLNKWVIDISNKIAESL